MGIPVVVLLEFGTWICKECIPCDFSMINPVCLKKRHRSEGEFSMQLYVQQKFWLLLGDFRKQKKICIVH